MSRCRHTSLELRRWTTTIPERLRLLLSIPFSLSPHHFLAGLVQWTRLVDSPTHATLGLLFFRLSGLFGLHSVSFCLFSRTRSSPGHIHLFRHPASFLGFIPFSIPLLAHLADFLKGASGSGRVWVTRMAFLVGPRNASESVHGPGFSSAFSFFVDCLVHRLFFPCRRLDFHPSGTSVLCIPLLMYYRSCSGSGGSRKLGVPQGSRTAHSENDAG
ncbi:hypothetical protein F5X68DRAFT_70833 [Plectosphaerella plurivora]|uniref:Uncharacterized protein n=1 Tax=Plectosphaerella plurivora TaxID=936078 RepID=A0A9P8VG56_9PEZI|nr:hypothetical protein F5X68DRAFT_70833 [Plectosphaerella plurivora]